MKFLGTTLLRDDNSSDHRPFAYTALLPAHGPRIKRPVRFPYRRRIRGTHSSSRFDRTPLTLRRAIRGYVTGHNFISFTEVADAERRKALRSRFWTTAQMFTGAQAECAAMFAKWAWVVEGYRAESLAPRKIPSRGTYCYALIATVRHRVTGQRVKVMVVHLPAHVETALARGDRTAQSSMYAECVSHMSLLAKAWADDPSVDAALIVGDWNINWRERWVREYIRESFPDYVCNWEGRVPPTGGTHGNRIIDFALVTKDAQ